MENPIVRFAVSNNVNFYKIELSRTLLHFAEFDFTYFWEQCIDAGKTARKTGRLPQQVVSNAKAAICRAHPYIEACISSDYAEIVTDCIIEYICHSERIGLEELWARCISPKNLYETAIFKRISEYKTNRAMNRWTSIVRIQEYAKNKLEFIYDSGDGPAPGSETIRTRKEYFDLTLSVAANELGCPPDSLPSVTLCTPSTLPNAAFVVGKVAKSIYRRFADDLADGRDLSFMEKRDCTKIRDQLAMEAYSYVKKMTRPNEIEMNFALESIRENPQELYLPNSLKAAVDLEFELMERNNIILRKCENCGRFFASDGVNTRCDRVNSSGKTCRKQYEELVESITIEARSSSTAAASENAEPTFSPVSSPVPSEEAAVSLPTPPPQPKRQPVTVPAETEKRAQKLYNALYKRVGKGIDENEFKEWSQYLSNMKKNLKIGEATLLQYEEFLDYSDKLCEEVKLASKNKTVHAPVEKTYEHNENKNATEAESASADSEAAASDSIEEAAKDKAADKSAPEPRVPQVEAAVVSSDHVEVKPFVPQAFDSLFDAVMAGASEDDKNESSEEKNGQKAVEIKMPQWEHLSREDVYGKKE